jgi:hypothetical protein
LAERPQSDHIYDSSGKLNSTGSANAYVVEVAEQIAGYHQGMPPIRFKANFGNTGSATANIVTQTAPSGLGAVTLKKSGGATDLANGDIVSGGVYTLIHDGTNFQVLELNSPGVADDSITNAKLANMVQATIKGRAAGAGTGDPTDLTAAQVLTILAAFSSIAVQAFTTPGANTYTPTSGMKFALAISTGAGGGGGGADGGDAGMNAAAGGGAAGGTCIELFSAATIGASQTVTIGTAGTAGADTGADGGAGGDTTFGALHTATGGPGGDGVTTTTITIGGRAAGGVPTGGLVNITGGDGMPGYVEGTNDFQVGGAGGASFWGGGPAGGLRLNSAGAAAGNAGAAYGAGGSGAVCQDSTTGAAGGAGKDGFCLVIELI